MSDPQYRDLREDFAVERDQWMKTPQIEDHYTRMHVNHIGCMTDIAMERIDQVMLQLGAQLDAIVVRLAPELKCKCGHFESEHGNSGCRHELPDLQFCRCREFVPSAPVLAATPPLCGHPSPDGICRTGGCRFAYCGLKTPAGPDDLSTDEPGPILTEICRAYLIAVNQTGQAGYEFSKICGHLATAFRLFSQLPEDASVHGVMKRIGERE